MRHCTANVLAVPLVLRNGESFASGRMSLEDILAKLDVRSDAEQLADWSERAPYDMLVVGGGPVGLMGALLLARRGVRCLLAEKHLSRLDAPKAHALNPRSLETIPNAKLEPSVKTAAAGTRYQFERHGYFCVDRESTPGKPVFNRTVTLKDTWAKIEKKREQ